MVSTYAISWRNLFAADVGGVIVKLPYQLGAWKRAELGTRRCTHAEIHGFFYGTQSITASPVH